MDYRQVLSRLQVLREFAERANGLTGEEQAEFAMVYGECEPVINQILGDEKVTLPGSPDGIETYRNMFEAGYFSSWTTHRHPGFLQLLKVIGRVRQLAEDPAVPQEPASIGRLVRTLNNFRECCQYLETPPGNERAVQNVIWIMLRAQFDRLDRESTLPKFGAKAYRPDFGVPDLATLIEVKFIGNATKVAAIQEEILADIPGYLSDATAYTTVVVFVYDAAQTLRDPKAFIDDLRMVDGIIDVLVIPGIG